MRLPHCLTYSYWDYQQAWYNTFFIQNPKKSHSWLFFFNSKITVHSLPNWFKQWWTYFGRIPDILTPNATHCLNLFKTHYTHSESEQRFPPFLYLCTNFFLPWVWIWNLKYHTQEAHSSPAARTLASSDTILRRIPIVPKSLSCQERRYFIL